VSLNEEASAVLAGVGPRAALLGTLHRGRGKPLEWMAPITEHPALGATEVWEIYNFTADAHPIHIYEVQFQVVDRQALVTDAEGVTAPHGRDWLAIPCHPKMGEPLQRHCHRVSWSGHPHQSEIRHRRSVRLALPHRRPRGQ
jgi:FtsP/CotA-like multicopper oxidase with cupredoxin domain